MKRTYTKEKKREVELILEDIYRNVGMDRPSNHASVLWFCYEDVCECADPEDWNDSDVAIAFRRFIEILGDRTPTEIFSLLEV